jgi:hypothetical protein
MFDPEELGEKKQSGNYFLHTKIITCGLWRLFRAPVVSPPVSTKCPVGRFFRAEQTAAAEGTRPCRSSGRERRCCPTRRPNAFALPPFGVRENTRRRAAGLRKELPARSISCRFHSMVHQDTSSCLSHRTVLQHRPFSADTTYPGIGARRETIDCGCRGVSLPVLRRS